MQNAAAWLGAQLKVAAERTVVLEYGDDQSEELSGWCARHQYDVMDNEGFATAVLAYDWQFLAADLPEGVFDYGRIVVVEGADKYESMPIGNQPWHEHHDNTGQMVTIHTKRIN